MTHSANLLSLLQVFQVELHQPTLCSNPQRVAALLHEDYEEIGRSGLRSDKRQTVVALGMDCPQIFAEGFKLAQISDGAMLLTYISFQRDAQGRAVRCTERSSIWLLTAKAGWQIRFHQGTPTDD
ncbi:nuclear transport factor 2 family protein [Serratia sarumanii]|uniref:nuclear transport factor 2 family protein n=1 Tax=Serratia sarumanii TaxID=3020826 RepID=UPI003F80C18F